MKKRKRERDARNVPTAWFVSLEVARDRGDKIAEAEAMRNLRRLGVNVAFRRTPKGGAK